MRIANDVLQRTVYLTISGSVVARRDTLQNAITVEDSRWSSTVTGDYGLASQKRCYQSASKIERWIRTSRL